MKKRNLALFFAIIMLFSCLSLNIFAADSGVEGGTVLKDTLATTAHTATQIEAAMKAASLAGTKSAFRPGPFRASTTPESLDIQGTSNLTSSSSIFNKSSIQSSPVGTNLVTQMTITFTNAIKTAGKKGFMLPLIYLANNSDSEKPHLTTTDGLVFQNMLQHNGATFEARKPGGTYEKFFDIKPNEAYTVTVLYNIDVTDTVNGTYGELVIYINGEVKFRGPMFNETENNSFKLDPTKPYVQQNVINGKTLSSNATVYYFAESLPAQWKSELSSKWGLTTANGSFDKIQAIALGKTFDGIKDAGWGKVRFKQSTSGDYSDGIGYTMTNCMIYHTNADEVENFVNHSLVTGEHEHDFTKTSVEITYSCNYCTGTKVVSLPLDADKDNICDICGVHELCEGAEVLRRGISLGKYVDLNVQMNVSDALKATEGAKVVLSTESKSREFLLADAVAESDGTYKFSLPLFATEMTEEVSVTVEGAGSSETYTTSIKEYVEQLIETDATAAALGKAILNYGAAAQTYFDVNVDNLANSSLDEADSAIADVLTALSDLNAGDYSADDKDAEDGVAFTSASLAFGSKTHVNLYFTASEAATVTVNGKAVTPVKAADGEYYITITNETPDMLTDLYSIVLADGNAQVEVNTNYAQILKVGISYATANEKTDFYNLLNAYGRYCIESIKYVESLTGEVQ